MNKLETTGNMEPNDMLPNNQFDYLEHEFRTRSLEFATKLNLGSLNEVLDAANHIYNFLVNGPDEVID